MKRVVIGVLGLAAAVFYGLLLGLYAVVPVVLCTYLLLADGGKERALAPLASYPDPKEIKNYRIVHPGTSIRTAAEALDAKTG